MEPNTPMQVQADLPASYAINYPTQHSLRVTDPDTLVSGFVRYEENGETVWERSIDAPTTRFDTTWTPTPSEAGTARVVFELTDGHSESPETRRKDFGIELLASTYRERTLAVEDFFDGSGVPAGYVTFPGHRTVPVVDGEARITPGDMIDADSLDAGLLRILFEADGYLDYSSRVSSDASVRVVPREHIEAADNNWSWEKHSGYLRSGNRWSGGLANPEYEVQTRWPSDAEIDVYLYDQSIFRAPCGPGECFSSSNDQNLLASDFFIQTSKEVHEELEKLLQAAGTNIRIRTHIESESEKEFPQTLNSQTITIIGRPDAPYPITHSDRDTDGYIERAYMMHQTDAEKGPSFVTRSAILSDSIESFGPNTTDGVSPERRIIWQGEYLQPITSRMLEVFYQFPPLTGTYPGRNLPNKDGGVTNSVEFYVPGDD